MAEKTLNSRVIHKHDTEVNWSNTTNFIPKIGEIIVYDPDENHAAARVKIGDGVKTVIELAFIDDAAKEALFREIDMVDDKVEALGQLVGNTSVPEQIQAAVDELHVVAKTGSWNDLEDRPLTTETITITYDGKTEGYVTADTGTNGAEMSMAFYKVSDLVLAKENIIGQTATAFNTGNINSVVITEDLIVEYEEGAIVVDAIALIYNDNATINSYLFPEKGVYFANIGSGMAYASSLTAAVTVFDEKLIPYTIARRKDIKQADWAECNESSASYVKNKTHYFYEGNPILENHSITITDENSDNETQLDVVVNLVKGRKYRVLIDGELITIEEAAPGLGGWFGSICIVKNNFGGFIGKSFCLRTIIDRETGEYTTTYIEGLPAGTYSLSIYEDSDFKQLDEMFIPTFTVEDIDALCSGYVAAEELLF